MNQLIVRDTAGQVVCTREMFPSERYALYQAHNDAELWCHEGKRYRMHSVAWRKPEQDCVLLVSFDSFEPVVYCDC